MCDTCTPLCAATTALVQEGRAQDFTWSTSDELPELAGTRINWLAAPVGFKVAQEEMLALQDGIGGRADDRAALGRPAKRLGNGSSPTTVTSS